MGKWLEKAQRKETPARADSVFSADRSGKDPNDTEDTKGTLLRSPLVSVRDWSASLAGLDCAKPLHGLDEKRWGALLRDARWLLDHFGQQAARDGWSALDLFGVLPGRDCWGGIADRLRSSRSLVMTADLALWRRLVTGSPESFARGAGEMPRLVALWDGFPCQIPGE